MRKTVTLVLSMILVFTASACSGTSSVTSDEGDGSGFSRVTGVTGSGHEYTASVDQDSHTCSVEYLGTRVDIAVDLIGWKSSLFDKAFNSVFPGNFHKTVAVDVFSIFKCQHC